MSGVLFWVWADHYWLVRERAEKTTFELTLLNMRSGVMMVKADQLIHGKNIDILPSRNPIDFLQSPPEGYTSVQTQAQLAEAKPGAWVYVLTEQTLYYKPQYHRYLQQPEAQIAVRLTAQGKIDANYQWF